MAKICSKCKELKPLDLFYKESKCKDGKTSSCKKCRDIVNRRYAVSHNAIITQVKSKYKKSDKGKSSDQKFNARKAKTEYGKAMHNAHAFIRRAMLAGKILKQPCSVCGEIKAETHHPGGYFGENRSVIIWLCRKHHNEIHNKREVL